MVGNGKSFECSVEGRRFASAKALAQHKKALHNCDGAGNSRGGRGNRNVRASRNKAANGNGGNSVSRRSRGSDILGTFSVDTKVATGSFITASPINPTYFPNTRFGRESALFTRWKPISLIIEIVSMAGAMTSGSYTAGWIADPDDYIPSGIDAPTMVGAMKPSSTVSISKKMRLRIPKVTTQKWYMVDHAEPTDSCHGKYYIVLSGAIGNLTSTSKISLMVKLHWNVEFRDPSLPLSISGGNTIYAESGYENYFTDSTNSWADGKKLSLKHTEGGALVPFIGIQPGVVYKIDASAKLSYYKDSSHTALIVYGVKIPTMDNAMAVFVDKQKADAYASSGNSDYCLDYVAAGPVVVPSNPAWVSMTKSKLSSAVSGELSCLRSMIVQLEHRIQTMNIDAASTSSDFSTLG